MLHDVVSHESFVRYHCNENYRLAGFISPIRCSGGKWQGNVPECRPHCDTRKLFSVTFVPNCTFDDSPSDCKCTNRVDVGTIARITCEPGYENVGSDEQVVTCGDDGLWSAIPTLCQRIGGEDVSGLAKISLLWQLFYG